VKYIYLVPLNRQYLLWELGVLIYFLKSVDWDLYFTRSI